MRSFFAVMGFIALAIIGVIALFGTGLGIGAVALGASVADLEMGLAPFVLLPVSFLTLSFCVWGCGKILWKYC